MASSHESELRAAGWTTVATDGSGNCLMDAVQKNALRLGFTPPTHGWRAAISENMIDLTDIMSRTPGIWAWRADFGMCGDSCKGCAKAQAKYDPMVVGRQGKSYFWCVEDSPAKREEHIEPADAAKYPQYFNRDGAHHLTPSHTHTNLFFI